MAATGPIPHSLDRLQEQLQQGPCVSAIRQHHTIRVDNYESETRWRDLVAAAVNETRVRSSLSIQVISMVYSPTPQGWADRRDRTGQVGFGSTAEVRTWPVRTCPYRSAIRDTREVRPSNPLRHNLITGTNELLEIRRQP